LEDDARNSSNRSFSTDARLLQTSFPSVLFEVVITFSQNLQTEIKFLIETCKGDHPDRFGRLNYWKCMLALIPFILERDIPMSNANEIAIKIGFSKDQVVRSLDRFVEKSVLVKEGCASYSLWKLSEDRFPTVYLLCRKRKLTHIVRHHLALNAIQTL
jgi:hypothetical protein